MSIEQSDNIYKDFLVPNRNNVRDLTVRALIRQLGNELMGGYGFHIMIGSILFILPATYGMPAARVSAFLITLMFIMGPIASLVKLMEVYIHMKVALNRINEFNEIHRGISLNR